MVAVLAFVSPQRRDQVEISQQQSTETSHQATKYMEVS